MKKTLLISFGIIVLGASPALSQESDLEFSGYLENTLTADENKAQDKTLIANETRVRLNIKNSYREKGDLSVSIVGNRYAGNKSINLLDYLPEEEAQRFSDPVEIEKTNDLWFQEAYGSLYFGRTTIRTGRQKYYTGTGYAWNPTDLFNWKDVLDPAYEIEGLDSIFLSRGFFEDSSLSLYYSFGTSQDRKDREVSTSDEGDFQVKLKTGFSSWEVALHYTDVRKSFYDYEGVISGSVALEDIARQIRWRLTALEISGEILGLGVHAEGGSYVLEEDDEEEELPDELKNHDKYLVGIDYTFESGLYLILEYYFEGLGESDHEEYTLNQRMAYLSGELDSLGKDNYYFGASYPLTDFSTLALYVIANANDSSVVANPWFTWVADDEITLNISAQIPGGEEESAIGRSGSALFCRINFSF